MAPKRKQSNPKETVAAAADRVVRRSTRLSAAAAAAPPAADPAPPKKKKTKTETKKKTKTKSKTETETNSEEEAEAEAALSPAAEEAVSEPETVDASKKIVIEHCKQCNSFKTRAIQVKEELEEKVAGVNVVVNPEKPRKGCFEIREEEEGGEIFVSLLDMKRPFPPLKALDMDKLISDIVEKLR